MRFFPVLSAFAIVIFAAGCQTRPSETDRQTVANLEKINRQLTALSTDLGSLEKKLKGPEVKPSVEKSPKYSSKGPDLTRLGKIKLPENPTWEQTDTYVNAILDASKGQTTFSSRDPQIAMLARIDPKYVDVLIDHINDYYVSCAMESVVSESNKKQILEKFQEHPELLGCINRRNWDKDAAKTIMEYLKNNRKVTDRQPHLWASALARLATPKDSEFVEDYFAHAGNPEMIFPILAIVDGFNVERATAKGWEYQKSKPSSWSKSQMAIFAARFGNKDALKYLIHACGKEKNEYMGKRMISAVNELTGKSFSPSGMEKWYAENESRLVFDPESGNFVVKKAEKAK